jgi:hypothetical protein
MKDFWNVLPSNGRPSYYARDSVDDSELKVFCFVYFDEAHTLCIEPNPKGGDRRTRTAYYNFGKVLAELHETSVFYLFLSTNSKLMAFAPSIQIHPSARAFRGKQLVPPYTELPFDVFSDKLVSRLKKEGRLNLKGVCDISVITRFGRPLSVTPYSLSVVH